MRPSHRKKNTPYSETPTHRLELTMTKIDFAKKAVALVIGVGTKQIVTSIIRDHVDPEKVTDRIAIEAATWVLSALVAREAKRYTDEMIDELLSQWQKLKSQIKEARES